MVNFDKISRYLYHAVTIGVFFILFSPLVVNNQFFFPFIVPRNILFRIATEVVFFCWLALAYINPAFRPDFKNWKNWNRLVLLLILFFGINLVAGILGLSFYRSLWSNYERMGGIFHYAHLLAFFLVLINVYKTKKDWHVFMTFSIFLATLMSVLAFAQWLEVPFLLKSSGATRLTATTGNPIYLAAYLIFNLFFVFYFLIKKSAFSLKTFVVSFLVFDVYLIVTSIFYKVAPNADWGWFEFLRTPILLEVIKNTFNVGDKFDAQSIKSATIFLIGYLFLQAFIFMLWFWRQKKYIESGLLLFLALVQLFIIYHTQTRGAIIGIAVGLIFLSLINLFLAVPKKNKQISLAFLALILAGSSILWAAKDSTFVKSSNTLSRLTSISLSDTTTETRFLTWEASWKGMTAGPKEFLIGYGPDNFYYVFDKNFPAAIYKDAGSQIWFDRAHNIIFEVGVSAGVLGLAVYVSILVLAGWMLIRVYKFENYTGPSFILIGLLVAFLVQNIFVFDSLNTDILFYFLLAFVVFLFQGIQGSRQEQDVEINYVPNNYLYFFGIAALLFLFIFFNIKTLQANHYIYQGLVSMNSGDAEKTFNLLKQGVDQSVIGKFEARQQLSGFVAGFGRTGNLPPAQMNLMVNTAVEELQKSVVEEPTSVRNYMFLSNFYNAMSSQSNLFPQKVIALMEPIGIKLSPTRPHIYYEIGQAYVFLGSFDKAYEYFSKGVELAPAVIEDRWNLLTVAIIFEKFDLAEDLYLKMQSELNWQPEAADYTRLVSLYARVNKVDKMIKLQEIATQLYPSPQNFAQLAGFYARVGQNAKARQAAENAIALDSKFKDQAADFFKALDTGELLDK